MIKKVFIVITFVTICLITFTGCDNMKLNNSTNRYDLITETYSNEQIAKLKKSVESSKITFEEFKKIFNVQCVRETHQGYYAVLIQEDNKNVFVFINKERQIVSVMVVDEFKTKNDFYDQVFEGMTKSTMLLLDSNTILTPISSVEMTAHLVQEGIFIVKYSRFLDGELITDPIVSSVEFVENKDISTNDDVFIKEGIPFVLEIDKK